jgi:hypothetical protein
MCCDPGCPCAREQGQAWGLGGLGTSLPLFRLHLCVK